MKRIFAYSLFVLLLISFPSCKKATEDSVQSNGQVEFTFAVDKIVSELKSAVDSGYVEGITNVVVTIEDLDGNVVKNSEKIEIYNMNGYYISSPISLVAGAYKLTHFFVLDAKNNVVYASPLKGSAKAYLVTNPLSISFLVQKDSATKLTPEVLSTAESTPEDFGYVTFSFEISKTFDFLVGAFVYNETLQNFELTTATLSVYNDTTLVYSTPLTSTSDTTSGITDSLGITKKITLPERYNNYTIKISKKGYVTYSKTFTKEELRLQYRKEDKGPLVVILQKAKYDLTNGLVAYYPFDGNAKDSLGTNHGIEYSHRIYSQGISGLAHNFDGITDYIKLTKTLEVSNGLSFSFWVNSRGADSAQNNGSIIAKYNMKSPQKMCLQINSFGGIAYNTQLINWIGVAMFNVGYSITERVSSNSNSSNVINPSLYSFPNSQNLMLNKWVHAVVNITSTEMQVYLNGVLCVKKTREVSTYFDDASEPTYIGNNLCGGEGDNNHFNGLLDNLRIYSRSLTIDEIQYIYLNKY